MKGPPSFSCGWVGGWKGVFLSQVVFVLGSALSIVRIPLGQWIVNFPCKLVLGGDGGGVQKQRVPNSTSLLSHML
jgi:hypothetical protein